MESKNWVVHVRGNGLINRLASTSLHNALSLQPLMQAKAHASCMIRVCWPTTLNSVDPRILPSKMEGAPLNHFDQRDLILSLMLL